MSAHPVVEANRIAAAMDAAAFYLDVARAACELRGEETARAAIRCAVQVVEGELAALRGEEVLS